MKRRTVALFAAALTIAAGTAAFTATPAMAGGQVGMMGQGYMDQGMMGRGNMGQGYMGQGYMDRGNMGQGMMGRGYMSRGYMGQGKGSCEQAEQAGVDRKLGVDDVRKIVEKHLERRGNERLKAGKIEAGDDNTIIAEIVTVDDSLVDRVEFDTRTGNHRRIN